MHLLSFLVLKKHFKILQQISRNLLRISQKSTIRSNFVKISCFAKFWKWFFAATLKKLILVNFLKSKTLIFIPCLFSGCVGFLNHSFFGVKFPDCIACTLHMYVRVVITFLLWRNFCSWWWCWWATGSCCPLSGRRGGRGRCTWTGRAASSPTTPTTTTTRSTTGRLYSTVLYCSVNVL